jgi:hypothetical protein
MTPTVVLGRLVAAAVFAVSFGSAATWWWLLVRLPGIGLLDGTVRFFAHFTHLTAVLVALASGLAAFAPRSSLGQLLTRPSVMGGLAVYVVMTGAVYRLTSSWTDFFLLWGWRVANVGFHYVMPTLFVIYWLVFVPKGALRARHAVWWLSVPVLFGAVTLIRGAVTGWYPYIFLNAPLLGTERLLIVIAAILSAFLLVGGIVVAIDFALGRIGRRGQTAMEAG